jgi:hypothetical protein
MATQDDFHDVPTQKQGMSSTSKVLLILGSIAGVCLLACCGSGIFVYFKAKDAFQNIAQNLQNMTTSDPEEIRERTADIVHIDIPEEFPPLRAFDFFLMKQILYGKEGSGSMVMIMEINERMQGGQGAAGMKQQREQMLRQLRQQQQAQNAGNPNTEITEESSETREFTINGEKVPFEFIKGRGANGVPTRQVVGMFAGRTGTIMLMIMTPESDYHEEAIVKMIESIRLPDDAEDSMDSNDVAMPEKQPASDDSSREEEPHGEGESTPDSSP